MSNTDTSNLPFPRDRADKLSWGNLSPTRAAMLIAEMSEKHSTPLLLCCKDNQTCLQLEEEFRFFLKDKSGAPTVLVFPDWEMLPYDHFSPHQDIISQRIETLSKIGKSSKIIIITSVTTAMHRLPPQAYVAGHSFLMSVGETLDRKIFRERLQACAYRLVSQVMEHGEYALRGSIIDIFPMGAAQPYRIDLFDDEIDSIRSFDPQTQRSTEKIKSISLLPAREFPMTEEAITLFRQQWREKFAGNPLNCPIYESVSEGVPSSGCEFYLPLFFTQTESLFDYLSETTTMITLDNCFQSAENYWEEIQQRYEQHNVDIMRPILKPQEVFFAANEVFEKIQQFPRLKITAEYAKKNNAAISGIPDITIDNKLKQPLHTLETFLNEYQGRVVFCAESAGRREVLIDLLKQISINVATKLNWDDVKNASDKYVICQSPLQESFILTDQNIAVISEAQLFERYVVQRRRRKQKMYDPNIIIRDLAELNIGSPVVHIEHGVGRYLGLQTLTIDKHDAEFLMIEYAGHDKIYVPVTDFDAISHYSGSDPDNAPLHKLGTDKWDKAKRKAKEKTSDVAAELLTVYAKREAAKGFPFKVPDIEYQQFAANFPFQETLDQENAIADVFQDMTLPRPMDRLICGDVGFGKTEVAMRAAFIAVQNNKQVAMLVPTTLLATQHFSNFQDRFSDFPITIDILSRFRSASETRSVIEKLEHNKIDIIIGTHKLLQKDVRFGELGLLIIDEEHRFGVKQKEHLKKMRSKVDILSLTATPIPRTLNMSMSGMREISIISTPPARRLSVKTFLHEHNSPVIREAIMREILRGGQVFYLHNKVETIERVAHDLAKIAPEAKIAIAHGQMRERQLENIMRDFYHQRFNLLVCTTIIESGIDIPSANTMIIDRADKFGLAQLHQLRGRVGRSHHQAYTYLLIPDRKAISRDAKKRLDAFMSLRDLGIGFTLASHDLEIRGCGELLGDEQSGHIQAIGYSLYMNMLERAVKALKQGQTIEEAEKSTHVDMDLNVSAIIPDDYIHDVQHRLTFYKRIANCETSNELRDLQSEMIDRYGMMKNSVKRLFKINELKFLAQTIGIQKLEATKSFARLFFIEKPKINPATIMQMIQEEPAKYQLAGSNAMKLFFADPKNTSTGGDTTDVQDKRLAEIEALLRLLKNAV